MNCKRCGAPLTKGNVRILRPAGKRPVRVCRTCPSRVEVTAIGDSKKSFITVPKQAQSETIHRKTSGAAKQRLQGGQDVALNSKCIPDYSQAPLYRFFITPEQAERIRRRLGNAILNDFGFGIEVIPVPAHEVEARPENFRYLFEVEIRGLFNGSSEEC